ncbi:MAG: hypothetical protein J0H65_14210 [Rhizobiales bacterium]|nr:hypothetical protein [Hyphomicrobiales bacterium]
MVCNAHNHAPDCPCGFGGDTGGGGWATSWRYGNGPSFGWLSDGGGTVSSYVDPNAHCPVCGARVFFYRSPYNGRVFFDALGPPWPKHPCTDNGYEPRRTAGSLAGNKDRVGKPAWIEAGWRPLYYPRIGGNTGRARVEGAIDDERMEVTVVDGAAVDPGPVFLREIKRTPGLYEIAYLHSNRLTTREASALAFDSKLAGAGAAVIRRAMAEDAEALAELGRYILYELEQPLRAKAHLRRALDIGVVDMLSVLGDLAVIVLFEPQKPRR